MFGEAIEAAVAKGWGLASVILLIVFVDMASLS